MYGVYPRTVSTDCIHRLSINVCLLRTCVDDMGMSMAALSMSGEGGGKLSPHPIIAVEYSHWYFN